MTPREAYVAEARTRAELLYEGRLCGHRSCGIALAETFGLPGTSYQALRRGGLTGEGPCGAIAAGMLVLGELLGDPDPAGPPTEILRDAAARYRATVRAALDGRPDDACNARVAPHGSFTGEARVGYCTRLAGVVAHCVAGTLWDVGHPRPLPPAPWATESP